jgi:hypothetical protein
MDLMVETFSKLGITIHVDKQSDTIVVPEKQNRQIQKTIK